MDLNKLTVQEFLDMKNVFSGEPKKRKEIKDGGIRICVLQRGWVVVGKFSQKGSECKLTDANVIRIWGTSKGLGEIAESGPTSSTKLDPSPNVMFHELVGVFQIQCNEGKWTGKLR